ncbi:MAG: hypothetical protein A2Z72_04645 [Omnitrophica bacterium RBG_13_46_9]|nr:MAG: hypothetical protein A2Z72_04645 [Omnitrophica bacterium RBG_13_46_9]
MKVVLVRPPETNRIWAGIPRFFNDGIFLFPPLGIMQLKAYIEKYTRHKVIIYDSLIHRADYEKLAYFIKKTSPRVVGISTFTHSLGDVVETAKTVKRVDPLIHVVLGGPHTYSFPEESGYLLDLGCVDSVILGDGEKTLAAALEAIDNNTGFDGNEGIIYKDKRKNTVKIGDPVFIKNLDELPFPSRDIYGIKRYYTPASHGNSMTTMITGRGCPYDCKFCDVQKRYRPRSIKNVVDEIELCGKLGFKEVFLIDDTFNTTKDRVIRLSEEILKRGIKIKWGCKARCDNMDADVLKIAKKAGCVRIHYGVETGTDSGLDSIDKRVGLDTMRSAFSEAKRAGIRTVAYFMIGCPHEKDGSNILETIDFARNLAADFAVFSLLSPYPDTAFYREGVKRGVLDPRFWQQFMKNPCFHGDIPTLWDEYFSGDELLRFLKLAHRKFYYRPKIFFNALFNIHSLTELKRLLIGELSLLRLEFLRKTKGRL